MDCFMLEECRHDRLIYTILWMRSYGLISRTSIFNQSRDWIIQLSLLTLPVPKKFWTQKKSKEPWRRSWSWKNQTFGFLRNQLPKENSFKQTFSQDVRSLVEHEHLRKKSNRSTLWIAGGPFPNSITSEPQHILHCKTGACKTTCEGRR